MEIIALTGQKGGTGKSTLALNVAVCLSNMGSSVVVLDRDPQGALGALAGEDEEFGGVPVIWDVGESFDYDELYQRLVGEGYDYLVIDTSPALGGDFLTVAGFCDILLVPTRPSRFDAQSLVNALTLLEEQFGKGGVPVYAVLNQVNEQLRVTGEMLETIKGYDIPVLKTRVAARTIHQLALADGESVFQRSLKESAKARGDIVKLTKEIKKELKKK